jgi:hypothetical protein
VTEDSVCSVLLCRRREDPPNQEADTTKPKTPQSPRRSRRPPIVFCALRGMGESKWELQLGSGHHCSLWQCMPVPFLM